MANKLAVVTGASSGIGLELAKLAAGEGYDLIVAADTPFVDAAAGLKDLGVAVEQIEADLSTLAFQTKDAAEGMQAFIDKRRARFEDK